MKSPLVLASKSLRDNRVCAPASHSPYTYRHQRAPYAALRRCPPLRPEFSVPRSSEDFPYSFDSPHKRGNIACVIVHAKACASRCFNAKMPHERLRRSEEHTSELQSLMRISYAVFCLKTKQSTHKASTNT